MPAPAPPEVVDAALLAVADGATQRAAGATVGVSGMAVNRWVNRYAERLERLGAALRLRWLKRTFRSADGYADALGAVVLSDERDEKGRPIHRGSDKAQCANVLLTHALPKGPESLTIVGDVDITNVSADVRVVVANGSDAQALRAKADELRAKLGF